MDGGKLGARAGELTSGCGGGWPTCWRRQGVRSGQPAASSRGHAHVLLLRHTDFLELPGRHLNTHACVCSCERAHTCTHVYTRTHAHACLYTHTCTHDPPVCEHVMPGALIRFLLLRICTEPPVPGFGEVIGACGMVGKLVPE